MKDSSGSLRVHHVSSTKGERDGPPSIVNSSTARFMPISTGRGAKLIGRDHGPSVESGRLRSTTSAQSHRPGVTVSHGSVRGAHITPEQNVGLPAARRRTDRRVGVLRSSAATDTERPCGSGAGCGLCVRSMIVGCGAEALLPALGLRHDMEVRHGHDDLDSHGTSCRSGLRGRRACRSSGVSRRLPRSYPRRLCDETSCVRVNHRAGRADRRSPP